MIPEHEEYYKAFEHTKTENSLHYVFHEIRKLYTGTQEIENVRKRWIWELLQNAYDARDPNGKKLIVEVEKCSDGKLVFLHNGRGFKANEISRLINSGTTKDSADEETQGKFGRGFLTTHLLSPTVEISAMLDRDEEEKWFNFTLKRDFNFTLERDNESKEALRESLERSESDFIGSISTERPSIPDPFTTQFVFPIHKSEAKKAVKEGLNALEKCAHYVIVFNQEFFSISIKRPNRTHCFQYLPSNAPKIDQITVKENNNGECSKRKYLFASSEKKTSVAVSIEINDNSSISLPIENIPRLYSVLPLVGTDSYSFPAVINNPDFQLPPDRDGVQLDGGDAASLTNKTIVEESCEMLVCLLKDAASKHLNHKHLHHWVEIPNTKHLALRSEPELKNCLRKFIEQIIHADVFLTQSDELISPKNAILPEAKEEERDEAKEERDVEILWDLLNDWKTFREKLPRRDEAIGWHRAVKSWKVVYGTVPRELKPSIMDCRGLVERLTTTCSCLEDLQNELQEGVCAVDWLNRLYEFLKDNELFDNEMRKKCFFLDQDNGFKQLRQLHRDLFEDQKLKDIAKLLGWPIKSELYNNQLTALHEIEGRADDWNQDYVVNRLLAKLKDHAKSDSPDDKFKDASVDLFAWIVSKKKYVLLSDFPLFAETVDSDETRIIRLQHPNPDDPPDKELPLAPFQSWKPDLQDYYELFPRRFIIAEAFFLAVTDQDDIWQRLEKRGYIRKSVIFRYDREVSFKAKDFLPQEPLSDEDHISKKRIRVTKIAYLTEKDNGIIDRVRQNLGLALKFWRFLTECVAVHDPEGLELTEIECSCEGTHHCYPAEWLEPVVNRSWIPIDRKRSDVLKADNLANLFEKCGWNPSALNENVPISKLLKAINISHLDLIRATFVPSGDLETVDNVITEILRKSSGNVNHLNHASKYIDAVAQNENLPEQVDLLLKTTGGDLSEVTEIVQDLKEDEKLFKDLERLRNRRRTINENRTVGNRVEKIVGRILKEKFPRKKFTVNSVHEGADFEITITQGGQTQGGQTLWIEVKSTRTDGASQVVKMSPLQAKKAVNERENFLLCVVPIPKSTEIDTEIDIEIIRENMWFIANIGDEITLLDENLDFLEEVRVYVTADTTSDVRLEVKKGEAGILVKKSVWKKNGFRLGELVEHLIRTKNNLVT